MRANAELSSGLANKSEASMTDRLGGGRPDYALHLNAARRARSSYAAEAMKGLIKWPLKLARRALASRRATGPDLVSR